MDSATHYDTYVVPFIRPFTNAVVGSLAGHQVQHVLDHGAGTGELTFALRAAYPAADVTALDPNEPFLQRLSATDGPEPKRLDVVVGRIAEQPWSGPRFDTVVSQLSLMFVADAAVEL